MMRVLLVRILGFCRGRRLDPELDDEVRFHIEMLVDENMRRGMGARDARAAAIRAFGGVTQMKEEYRDRRGLPGLEMLVQDARYGVRSLMRTPAFTLAALLTLALGIGANSAIFSVVNAVLLQPLPYPDADRLVQFGRMVRGAPLPQINHSGRRYMFFRDHLQSLDALAAWSGVGFNLATSGGGEYVTGRAVSKEYFRVFGAQPLYGQAFTSEHDAVGGPDAIILSYDLWKRSFAANPSVIGNTVLVAERPHTILGVMPDGFVATTATPVDVYVPLRPSTTGRGGGLNYTVVGRMKPGVSLEQMNAEAASVFEAFRREFPNVVRETELGAAFTPYQEVLSRGVRPALLVMLGAVGALLLIACANTANLLLARASSRGREIAVRAALGAARGRIVRQLLTESVLLSLTGAVLGLVLAYWIVPTLLALTPPSFNVYQQVRIDGTVLGVTLALALVTGVLFGLAPAMSLSRHDLVEAFKEDATRTTSSRRSAWLRKSLVVAEVALCMLLLVGAGLLIQTFVKMRNIDPGFDLRGVLTARMSLQGDKYSSPATLMQFYDQGLERIRSIPGVQSAAVVNGVPIEFGLNLNVTVLDGPEVVENALTDWRYATTDYFKTMGIPIVRGRPFTEGDGAGAPRVAVVNERFAKAFFKDTDPIGRHIRVFEADGSIEIVGIARDVREQGLVGTMPALMYVPVAQTHEAALRTTHGYFQVSWVVRAPGAGPELVSAVREQIRTLDPERPFSAFRTMEEVKRMQFQMEQFQMTLLVVFAGIGLLLATAGIYGLISYSVAQRTREFGIRIALGASPVRIVRSIVAQGALLAFAGVIAGVAAAALATRTLQSFLFGVGALDRTTFLVVAAILISVAALASLVPALRALRLNPVTALRE